MPGPSPEDRPRTPRASRLLPWLALTSACAAALVWHVTTAEMVECTLEQIPDRYARIFVPEVSAETVAAAAAPEAGEGSKARREEGQVGHGGGAVTQSKRREPTTDRVLPKSKLLLKLIGTTGESNSQANHVWTDDENGSGLGGTDAALAIDDIAGVGGGQGGGVVRGIDPRRDALSTFSIDVDTASFTRAASALAGGRLPSRHELRVEEFLNAMPYDYDEPPAGRPLEVHAMVAPSPFDDAKHLLRVGLQARTVPEAARKPAHLTFLIDVSCSMASADKLPLVKESLHQLVRNLEPEDTVAMVTYAGGSAVVLPPTSVGRPHQIHDAISQLTNGGGTSMAQGVFTAYELALSSHTEGSINRVVLASDGDANIGHTRHEDITPVLQRYADRGITLTTLGFGQHGYRDDMMEQLANDGDGAYYFIPSQSEANRVLGHELTGTLQVVARDVKVQVDFAPEAVKSYRLVGYDNRRLADADFANDQKDAGEVGSGHQVTALYELELHPGEASLGAVHLRYKAPGAESPSEEIVAELGRPQVSSVHEASDSYRLAVATAGVASVLRGELSPPVLWLSQLEDLVRGAMNPEIERHRELLQIIETAKPLYGAQRLASHQGQ